MIRHLCPCIFQQLLTWHAVQYSIPFVVSSSTQDEIGMEHHQIFILKKKKQKTDKNESLYRPYIKVLCRELASTQAQVVKSLPGTWHPNCLQIRSPKHCLKCDAGL